MTHEDDLRVIRAVSDLTKIVEEQRKMIAFLVETVDKLGKKVVALERLNDVNYPGWN